MQTNWTADLEGGDNGDSGSFEIRVFRSSVWVTIYLILYHLADQERQCCLWSDRQLPVRRWHLMSRILIW